jgi:hypothetical protein
VSSVWTFVEKRRRSHGYMAESKVMGTVEFTVDAMVAKFEMKAQRHNSGKRHQGLNSISLIA